MEASVHKIQTIDNYKYLGGGYFEPRIALEDYVLKLLSEGPLTRVEMVRLSGIPRTTLYDTLIKLIQREEVLRFKKRKNHRRPKVHFILRKHAKHFTYRNQYEFY